MQLSSTACMPLLIATSAFRRCWFSSTVLPKLCPYHLTYLFCKKNHKPSTPDFSFLLDCHGEPGLSLVFLMFEQFHFVDFLIKFDEVD